MPFELNSKAAMLVVEDAGNLRFSPGQPQLVPWTQLFDLLPAMQFSVALWGYNDQVVALCLRWIQFHVELSSYFQSLFAQTITDSTPVVRSLFWPNPADLVTYAIDDQFMSGERFLVAPALRSGVTVRDIYLPQGRWCDHSSGQDFEGLQWLKDYPAPLETLPLFERAT